MVMVTKTAPFFMHDSRLPFTSGTTTKSKVLLYAHLVSHIYVESRIKGGEKSVASNFDPMSLWELTVHWVTPLGVGGYITHHL